MDNILSLLNEYRIIVGACLTTLMLLVAMKVYWDKVSFYWLRISCSFPVFGKVSRLSKSTALDSDNWFISEKSLMSEFQPYFEDANKDADFFGSCKNYLKKATENGRKELPFYLWIVLIALVFGEAMGFSYVLAGFTIPGASENLQQKAALVIAFMISALLVFLTHRAGAEIYTNKLVKKVRTWCNQQAGGGENLSPDTRVDLTHDHIDNNEKNYKQLLNRIDANATVTAKYPITIITIIFISMVAIGATYVRGQVLDQMLTEEHQDMVNDNSSGVYADPYGKKIPDGPLTQNQKESDDQVAADIIDAQKKGGWGTFIVLAVIFVFLQIMGILIGIMYGFAGKESGDAFKYIGSFKTRQQFENYYKRKKEYVAQIAQKNLADLQKKMSVYVANNATESSVRDFAKKNTNRNFYRYIALYDAEQKRGEQSLYDQQVAHEKYINTEPMDAESSKTSPAVQSIETVATTVPSAEEVSLEERMARIKQKRIEKEQQDEESLMASMSDEELERYMEDKGLV